MTLRYQVGDTFPSLARVDDRGDTRTLEEIAAGQPLLLVFFRGPW